MTAYINKVSEIIRSYINTNLVKPYFQLEMQGVVHMYTQLETDYLLEIYSCSFKSGDVQLYNLSKLFTVFNHSQLKEKGLTVKNVSYLEFDDTKQDLEKRYQVQLSFRGF